MKVFFWALGVTVGVALLTYVGLRSPIWRGGTQFSHPQGQNTQNEKSRALIIRALRGSPEASTELIRIYDTCSGRSDADQKRSELCWTEMNRWIEIGLQNGSATAAQMKVNELLQSKSCIDIYRAEYWLTRYKQAGAGNEMMWSSDASVIEQKKRSCSW